MNVLELSVYNSYLRGIFYLVFIFYFCSKKLDGREDSTRFICGVNFLFIEIGEIQFDM